MSQWVNCSQKSSIKINVIFMHRAIMHNDNIYFFFGDDVNTVQRLNLTTMSVSQHVIPMTPRTFYTLNVYKDKFYVFGGHMMHDFYNNDIIVFDAVNFPKFTYPNQKFKPLARRYHVSSNIGNYLYVFGGEVSWDVHLNDLWKMNYDTLEWSEVHPIGMLPKARRYHTMVEYKDALFVFGGRDEQLRMNSLCCYDPYLNSWKDLVGIDPPLPRAGHTCVQWKQSMYLFGGNDGNEHGLKGDIFEYKFERNEWKLLDITGEKPVGRYWHVAVVTPDGDMYVQGGRADAIEFKYMDVWKISLGEMKSLQLSLYKNLHNFTDIVII